MMEEYLNRKDRNLPPDASIGFKREERGCSRPNR
jgi:hypothetical protein